MPIIMPETLLPSPIFHLKDRTALGGFYLAKTLPFQKVFVYPCHPQGASLHKQHPNVLRYCRPIPLPPQPFSAPSHPPLLANKLQSKLLQLYEQPDQIEKLLNVLNELSWNNEIACPINLNPKQNILNKLDHTSKRQVFSCPRIYSSSYLLQNQLSIHIRQFPGMRGNPRYLTGRIPSLKGKT